ncbi:MULTISPECIES: RICIN domain-containing protein [Pseudofrankia]|uniref:RICIN domain-containing protein n=1 Tax=Pseudofrankia TaxID=2994363 RepID=UPI000234CA31|nr:MULTISPECIES: hypothetical protein [Pseudofrankia]OHV33393.1 hypothetical protein BCD49_27425 [Pseudofrankia sp. EUN1h]
MELGAGPAGPIDGRGWRRRARRLALLAAATLCLTAGGIASASQASADTAVSGPPSGIFRLHATFRTVDTCLDDPRNSTGTDNVIYGVTTCNGTAAQNFYLIPGASPGLYRIRHGGAIRCLVPDIHNPSVIVQHDCEANGPLSDFDWQYDFTVIDTQVYELRNIYYGECLAVSHADYPRVTLAPCTSAILNDALWFATAP